MEERLEIRKSWLGETGTGLCGLSIVIIIKTNKKTGLVEENRVVIRKNKTTEG